MSDQIDDNDSKDQEDESFAELFESYDSVINHDLKQGDKVEGKIISISSDSIYVSTGSKSDGVVAKSELLDENNELPYEIGDSIELYVVSLTESEIILSKALSGIGSSSMLKEASFTRTPVEGKVTATIKGGFSVEIMGQRAFCPVSQIDVKYVETPEDYVGDVHNFIITQFSEGGRNIVVSRREFMNIEISAKKKLFFEELSEGDSVQGTVTKLMPYGAFIELIPGIEGMAHISELSWSRVEKPDEVVKQGQVVRVKVLKIDTGKDADNPKLSLSMKQTSSNPWDSVTQTIKTGEQVTGKVIRIAPFGAFVELAPGLDGLVHLSEMSHTRRVVKADDVVSQGETVQVVVKSIDLENRRISLSIKDALGDPWTGAAVKFKPGSVTQGTVEKKESFGLFITLKEGITGLMPSSLYSRSSKSSEFDTLKPGNTVKVMVEDVDEEKRRITLAPPDLKDGDDWKNYAGAEKETLGTMGSVLMEAMKKKK